MAGGASAASATLISSLPFTDADTVPTTDGLWYKFVCPVSGVPNAISVFSYAASLTNQRLRVFSPDGVTAYPASDPGNFVNSRPFQVMLAAGVTYYFNIYNEVGAYTLSVITGPDEPVPTGSILVNNDIPNYPLALLSATDGHVLRFMHPFPAGETADVIASGPGTGKILVHSRNYYGGSPNHYIGGDGHLKLYSGQFELLADLPYIQAADSYTAPIRWGRLSGSFYVGQQSDPANAGNSSVTTVTADGAFGPTTWNLSPTWDIGLIAPSGSETILYGARLSSGSPKILGQWDLVNDVALPDLAPALSSFRIDDLLVLADDTILVAYVWFVANHTPLVLRYDPDGTVLNTYTLTGSQSTEVRLARALDDPISFWVWTRTNAAEDFASSTTLNKFANLRAADGVVLAAFSVPQFRNGGYQGAKSATPLARSGAAESCPFLILRDALETGGTLDVTDFPSNTELDPDGDPDADPAERRSVVALPGVISPQVEECPCPDDPWTLALATAQLSARLHDPANTRWSALELHRIIWEALRTWNAFTGWAIGRGTFTTTPGQAFYDLTTVLPTLRGPHVLDAELLWGVNDKLLEGAVTPQFVQDFLGKCYLRRHQQVLIESGVVLVRRYEGLPIPPPDGRVLLDPCILAVRRVAWSENGDSTTIPLARDDQWCQDRFTRTWVQRPQRRPRFWAMSTRPPQMLQLAPIPTHTGTLDFICIVDCTPIPPDWTWLVPFGVLADALGQTGPGNDPLRSQYAEQRFRHGLEAMKTGPVVHAARLNGQIMDITATPDADAFRRSWQTRTGTPRELLTFGQTLIGLSPIPDDEYEVMLDVVRIAPLPVSTEDPVELPPAARDVVLDYAEHLALFKEGPGELDASSDLLRRFLTAAGVRLSLDQALTPNRSALWAQASHDQRGAAQHHMPADPSGLTGVGSQPTFPNGGTDGRI